MRRLMCAVLTVAAVLGVTATPAQAATHWSFVDDFESSVWTEDGDGTGMHHADYVNSHPRSGRRELLLRASGTGTWAAIGRTVRVPSYAPNCTASIALSGFLFRPDGTTRINLEVIDPATWTYVNLTPITLSSRWRDTYVVATTTQWTANPGTVYFRVAQFGYDGRTIATDVDDFSVTCTS